MFWIKEIKVRNRSGKVYSVFRGLRIGWWSCSIWSFSYFGVAWE